MDDDDSKLIELQQELHLYRNETRAQFDRLAGAISTTFTLFCVVVMFLMQAGFCMLEAGVVREQSVRDILLKNVLDVSLGAFAWFVIGCILAKDGGSWFIGWPPSMDNRTITPFDAVLKAHGDDQGAYLLSFMYAVASTTIVSGAIAERTQQRAYIVLCICVTGVVYPVTHHWLWSDTGWLSCRNPDGAVLGGAYDFAGGGVVHLTAGMLALAVAKAVGPRAGRFDPLTGRPVELRGHSSTLVVLGTLLLWVGWLGFNVGSTPSIVAIGATEMAARTAVRTTLSASAGSLAAIAFARCRKQTVWSLEHACNGLLAGLVSITASAPAVSHWVAIVAGAVGGVIYLLSSQFVARVLRVDDVIDAFAVHGACGIWGLLVVGLAADGSVSCNGREARGMFHRGGDAHLLGAALLEVVAISAWALLCGGLLFGILRKYGVHRVPDEVEITGIDISELGRPAYSGIDLADSTPRLAAIRPISPTDSVATATSHGVEVVQAVRVDAPQPDPSSAATATAAGAAAGAATDRAVTDTTAAVQMVQMVETDAHTPLAVRERHEAPQ